VIPIPWDLEKGKFDTLLESTNGVLLTGGDAPFWEIDNHGNRVFNDFQRRLNYVVNFVKQKKYEGIHFPLWAVCQGMEAVSIAITHDLYVLDNYIQFGKLATVQFTPKTQESTMFQFWTQDSFTMLEENPVVFYYHQYGLNTSAPEKYPVFTQWSVTGISKDDNGKEFITAMESKDYPIYVHMFHTERVLWEANHLADSKHFSGVIYAIKLLAKSFASEAAKNSNKFESKELAKALEIENFSKEGEFYVFNSAIFEEKWMKAVETSNGFLIFLLVVAASVGLYYGYENYYSKKEKDVSDSDSLIDKEIPLVHLHHERQ